MSGASLGGMMTLTTACVEPKLAFAISIAAHLDLPSVMLEASLLTRFRRELATFGWGPEHVGDYLRELGFQELKPAIPKDRILLIAGKYDRILRPERLKALWTRWEEPVVRVASDAAARPASGEPGAVQAPDPDTKSLWA